MSDSNPKQHPQTGLPKSDKPTQQRVVEQATDARQKTREQSDDQASDRSDQQHETQTARKAAGYDEALAGRELDGGESLLSGVPREADSKVAADHDVPDAKPQD